MYKEVGVIVLSPKTQKRYCNVVVLFNCLSKWEGAQLGHPYHLVGAVNAHLALQQHTKLHHLICVAGALEGLFLIHVLSRAFSWQWQHNDRQVEALYSDKKQPWQISDQTFLYTELWWSYNKITSSSTNTVTDECQITVKTISCWTVKLQNDWRNLHNHRRQEQQTASADTVRSGAFHIFACLCV